MSYVDPIIAKFGGVRPMATRLGKPPSTVQSWKSRKSIPDDEKPGVLRVALAEGLDLRPEHFFPAVDAVAPEGEPEGAA